MNINNMEILSLVGIPVIVSLLMLLFAYFRSRMLVEDPERDTSGELIVFSVDVPGVTRYLRRVLSLAIIILLVPALVVCGAFGNDKTFYGALFAEIGMFIAFVLIGIVLIPLEVKSLKYRVEGTTLRIERGVIQRTGNMIPLECINDVRLIQGPIMRPCGIWSLRIQTSERPRRSTDESLTGVIDAERVRETILSLRDQATESDDMV